MAARGPLAVRSEGERPHVGVGDDQCPVRGRITVDHVGIVDRSFIFQRAGTCPAKTLDHMQCIRVPEAAGKLRLVIETDRIDDQCVSLPMPVRIAHPGRIQVSPGLMRNACRRDNAKNLRKYVKNDDAIQGLQAL